MTMKMCVLFSMRCWFIIDACMIFVNLNVEKMDIITIWKIIYYKFGVLIKRI